MRPTRSPTIVRGLAAFCELADYVTLNVSSPNTPGLRALQKREALARILACPGTVARPARPLFLKIAPDLDPEDEAGHRRAVPRARHRRADRRQHHRRRAQRACARPLAAEAGGLSGRPLFPRSTRLLARMAVRLGGRVPLIGVGGVATGADAYAKIRAGAAAVQLYTALIYQGPGVVRRIAGRSSTPCWRATASTGSARRSGWTPPSLANARIDQDRRVDLRP